MVRRIYVSFQLIERRINVVHLQHSVNNAHCTF